MKILKINGAEKQFPAGIPETLGELLKHMNINEATVAAEIDGEIIERSSFTKTQLSAGQTIELIRYAGGGA